MYIARIVKFDDIIVNKVNSKGIINEDSKIVLGLIYNGNLIDINNGDIYPILDVNEKGFIRKDQNAFINKDYAIFLEKCENVGLINNLKGFKTQLKINKRKHYVKVNSKKLQKRYK